MSEWLCRQYNNSGFPFNNSITVEFAFWLHKKICWDMRQGKK